MEEVDTRDRIAKYCIQEAIAVQDMLAPCAARRSRSKRIVEWIRMALLSRDGAPAGEVPAMPSPATILLDPAAAGPSFEQWRKPEPQTPATRKAALNGRTSSASHA